MPLPPPTAKKFTHTWRRELAVLYGDMERRVQVGGQEEDALVVLQQAEGDGDQFIALQVLRSWKTSQEDGVPLGAHLQHVGDRPRSSCIRERACFRGRTRRLGSCLRLAEEQDHGFAFTLEKVSWFWIWLSVRARMSALGSLGRRRIRSS